MSLKTPFFSVVIPTKNRSFLIEGALRSVLRQSFGDCEVILVDNDDTDATRKVVETFQDSRIRYVRSIGLSMPDNWERGCAAARGEYICFLEDKQAFYGNALEYVHGVLTRARCSSVRWRFDVFNDLGIQTEVSLAKPSNKVAPVSCTFILDRFANHRLWESASMMPIPHYSAIHRSMIESMQRGPYRRACPPVSPDFMMAFQALAFSDEVLQIGKALVVTSVRNSNGRSSKMKSELFKQFTKELGGDQNVFYRHTPIKAFTTEGCIYNDYEAARQTLKGRLNDHPINWANYFVECHTSIVSSVEAGVDMTREEEAWRVALSHQEQKVQAEVMKAVSSQRHSWKQKTKCALKRIRQGTGLIRVEEEVRDFFRALRGRRTKDIRGRFSTILEYVEWADGQRGTSHPHVTEAPDAAYGH